MKTIINCETNEITTRELTAAEIKQQKIDEAEAAAKIQDELTAAAEKTAAKIALLEKLGITEEEASLLLA